MFNPLLYKIYKEEPQTKLLEFIIEDKFDYTITQMAKGAKVSRSTVRRLIKKDILIQTRNDDKSIYYKLNIRRKVS